MRPLWLRGFMGTSCKTAECHFACTHTVIITGTQLYDAQKGAFTELGQLLFSAVEFKVARAVRLQG